MTRTSPMLRMIDRTIDRTPTIHFSLLPAAERSLSKAFDAILDTLFVSLEPAVDKTASHRVGRSRATTGKQAYAGFDAPAYRRHGRLIPELEGSNL